MGAATGPTTRGLVLAAIRAHGTLDPKVLAPLLEMPVALVEDAIADLRWEDRLPEQQPKREPLTLRSVLEAIREHGPITAGELRRALDDPHPDDLRALLEDLLARNVIDWVGTVDAKRWKPASLRRCPRCLEWIDAHCTTTYTDVCEQCRGFEGSPVVGDPEDL